MTIGKQRIHSLICSTIFGDPLVLKHMRSSKCKGALIIPYWPSANFWPMLIDRQQKFLPFIEHFIIFEEPNQFFN